MKHTLFSRTVQIACVKTHAILRTRAIRLTILRMRHFRCVYSQRKNATYILSESTLTRENKIRIGKLFFILFILNIHHTVITFIGTCHYKYFKISTHHTNTQKTTLASYQTKNRLQNLSSHIQNTYKSTTYISLQ